jgi:mannose-6-phosphate isomerase-like protein (cupin superfamily)
VKELDMLHLRLAVVALCLLSSTGAFAQAVGGAEKARPVSGDPGISTMQVLDTAEFRVLRDYAEPGATRRMHAHADATWHVFVLVTGQLALTVEGESPMDVSQGQVLSLKGGVQHTFKNTGTVAATIVEVFGRKSAPAAEESGILNLAFLNWRGFQIPNSAFEIPLAAALELKDR